jgi:uncharacterized membrane protein YbjE (DUF340 family)
MQTADAFSGISQIQGLVGKSILFSISSSSGVVGLLYLVFRKSQGGFTIRQAEKSGVSAFGPIVGAVAALCLVVCGVGFGRIGVVQAHAGSVRVMSATFLYVLIVLVGMDVASLRIRSLRWSHGIFITPLLVAIGSIAGGSFAAWVADEDIRVGVALACGFGWFTLSSALFSHELGDVYGAIALLTDLFRELAGIFLLFLYGRRYSSVVIGACGATSLDSTLGLIRKNCHECYLPLALMNGLVLTLLAPIMISLLLAGYATRSTATI